MSRVYVILLWLLSRIFINPVRVSSDGDRPGHAVPPGCLNTASEVSYPRHGTSRQKLERGEAALRR